MSGPGLQSVKAAQSHMPASSSVLLGRALAAHNRGDWGAAQDLYRTILAEEPEHAQATHLLGTLLLQMGENRPGRSEFCGAP